MSFNHRLKMFNKDAVLAMASCHWWACLPRGNDWWSPTFRIWREHQHRQTAGLWRAIRGQDHNPGCACGKARRQRGGRTRRTSKGRERWKTTTKTNLSKRFKIAFIFASVVPVCLYSNVRQHQKTISTKTQTHTWDRSTTKAISLMMKNRRKTMRRFRRFKLFSKSQHSEWQSQKHSCTMHASCTVLKDRFQSWLGVLNRQLEATWEDCKLPNLSLLRTMEAPDTGVSVSEHRSVTMEVLFISVFSDFLSFLQLLSFHLEVLTLQNNGWFVAVFGLGGQKQC